MDIVILTPIEIEFKAVCSHIENLIDYTDTKNYTSYKTGVYNGKNQTFKIVIRQTGSRNTDLSIATERAIQSFNPSVALLVGIAGGIKDATIGDVVVGTKAYNYEAGKIVKEGFVARPDVKDYSHALIEQAKVISQQDAWRKGSPYATPQTKVLFGPIASGDKVVTNTQHEVYQIIKRHFNDTLAIEMESIGFAKTFSAYPKIQFLNIRSISDLLDNKSASDAKGSQAKAAANVAAFVFALIDELNISKTIELGAMDVKKLLGSLVEIIFPIVKMDSMKKIGNEFREATDNTILEIWDRVRPLFIEEIKELSEEPNDEEVVSEIRNVVKRKLRKELKNDDELKNKAIAATQKIDEGEIEESWLQLINYGKIGNVLTQKYNYGTINISNTKID